MSVENDILSIAQLIADAKDCLRRASDLAVEASGYEAGRQCPDCGGRGVCPPDPETPDVLPKCRSCDGAGAVVPKRDGNPLLLRLADGLTTAEEVVEMAVTPEAEALFKETQEYADDVQDRKDALRG